MLYEVLNVTEECSTEDKGDTEEPTSLHAPPTALFALPMTAAPSSLPLPEDHHPASVSFRFRFACRSEE